MAEQYKSITGLVDDLPLEPQFLRAEYRKAERAQLCGSCGRRIEAGVRSYVLDSKLVCERCEAAANPTSNAPFVRGLLFGIGAAILGLGIYAGFTIVTHFYFGYVAVAVGWMVAKAIMVGSRGEGGTRYQIAAVALTYAAISLASVPILIAQIMQDAAENGTSANIAWGNVAGRLAAWGIASPFLGLRAGFWGVVGLLILCVGLRIAWRVTAEKTHEPKYL